MLTFLCNLHIFKWLYDRLRLSCNDFCLKSPWPIVMSWKNWGVHYKSFVICTIAEIQSWIYVKQLCFIQMMYRYYQKKKKLLSVSCIIYAFHGLKFFCLCVCVCVRNQFFFFIFFKSFYIQDYTIINSVKKRIWFTL